MFTYEIYEDVFTEKEETIYKVSFYLDNEIIDISYDLYSIEEAEREAANKIKELSC